MRLAPALMKTDARDTARDSTPGERYHTAFFSASGSSFFSDSRKRTSLPTTLMRDRFFPSLSSQRSCLSVPITITLLPLETPSEQISASLSQVSTSMYDTLGSTS